MLGKSAHMHFINNQILHRNMRGLHVFPIEIRRDNAATITAAGNRLGSPFRLTCNSTGIRVEDNIIRIKQHAARRVIGAIYAVGVFKLSNIQTKNNHCVYISHAIFLWEWKHGKWFLRPTMEQQQRNARCPHRRYGKVHAVRQFICTIFQTISLAGLIACNFTHWMLKKAHVWCTESCMFSRLSTISHHFRMTLFGHIIHLNFKQRIKTCQFFIYVIIIACFAENVNYLYT